MVRVGLPDTTCFISITTYMAEVPDSKSGKMKERQIVRRRRVGAVLRRDLFLSYLPRVSALFLRTGAARLSLISRPSRLTGEKVDEVPALQSAIKLAMKAARGSACVSVSCAEQPGVHWAESVDLTSLFGL